MWTYYSQLPTPSSQVSTTEVTCSDIFDALCTLKSPGCDNNSSKVFVHCCTSLPDPITRLFSFCFQACSIPKEGKIYKIPIPKKGDFSNVSNYRTTSLLCVLSKVLESIFYSKIFPLIQPLISH